MIDKIKSLSDGNYNWVYVGIRNSQSDIYGSTYVYEFESALSKAPTLTDVSNAKNSAVAGTLTFSGSNEVLGLSNYLFGFTTTIAIDASDQSDNDCTDFLVVDFGSAGLFSRINEDFSAVTVDNLGKAFILPQTQKIIILFPSGLSTGAKLLNILNLVSKKDIFRIFLHTYILYKNRSQSR